MPHPAPGRPRALDDFKRHEICALLSAGCGIREAARYVGCDPSTIHREAQRNDEFREQLRQAEAVGQLRPLQAMQAAVTTHWRAAAWMLERTLPGRFAPRERNRFGRPEAHRLLKNLVDILESEIDDPQLCDQLLRRITAAVQYATRQACDARRSSRQLRQAVALFEQSQTSVNYFGRDGSPDSSVPTSPSHDQRAEPTATIPASPCDADAPSASSVAISKEFCNALSNESPEFTSEISAQPAQNERVLQ